MSSSVHEPHHVEHGLPQGNVTRRIGRYQIIKTLGEGSFGKVKLAYHMASHARVALKIINRKTLAKSDMQGRVEREISYLRLLRHPHIIKLYDVIKSKDEIIMVIEFAGKELFDYIVRRGKMPEDEARRFFQQIMSAVEYCHRHKIVHRDLKPENLLLDENLNVKIADFGLSNIMTDGNFLKTSCGSPNYAAPEVISGKLYAGPEVDVWSCGVILYVMLCGRLPFDDEFIPELFKKISSGVYTIPSHLSSGAKRLLQRALVVNPLDRITVGEIMDDAWVKIGMPSYLLPPEKREIQGAEEIDEELVGALGRTMGYDQEQVYDALKTPTAEGSEIRDAYKLIRDNRMSKDTGDDIDRYINSEYLDNVLADNNKNTQKSAIPHASKDKKTRRPQNIMVAPQYTDLDDPDLSNTSSFIYKSHSGLHKVEDSPMSTPSTTIAILPSSLPAYHRANMAALLTNSKKITPASSKKTKTRWHFGIRSRSYPLDVMGEIYRALKNLGAQWASPSEEDLWTIHVRWKCQVPNSLRPESPSDKDSQDGGEKNTEASTVESSDSENLMKMRIQLYQLEQNNYLVDFKFDGWGEVRQGDSSNEKESPTKAKQRVRRPDSFSAYPFLNLAIRLIVELAVNSQAA